MQPLQFNIKHSRVVRARLRERVNTRIANGLVIIGSLLVTLSVILIVLSQNAGWFSLAVGAILLVVYVWQNGDLKTIAPQPNGTTLEELLVSEILGRLSNQPINEESISQACLKTDDYMFLSRRFGLTDELALEAATSCDAQWWQKATSLWNSYPEVGGIGGAHVIVAMIMSSSKKQKILNSIQTTEDDLLQGLTWLSYWKEMYATVQQRRSKASFARDLAVGYTPMLNRFAFNISRDIEYGGSYHRSVLGHPELIATIHNALVQSSRRNCMLVGDVGVGKSTIIEAFADSLLFEQGKNSPLQFHQIYVIDTAAILTQMNSQMKLENTIISIIHEAAHAKNIILFFPDIANLFGIEGGIDISGTMVPYIQNGTARMLFSATPGQWQWLQQNKPQVVALMNYQAITPPPKKSVLMILENKVIFIEGQYSCLFTYNALKEVYRLAERYGPDLAMPAKAIQVLEAVARNGSNTVITKESVVKAVEKTTGIKAGVAGSDERKVLLELETILHEKVVGQDEAIAAVVSALQRSRAGVSSQNKPIGTFLFLGPTGVGKTETAKAVAQSYFGGEDRLIRIDMNEFVTSDSIQRFLQSGSTTSASLLDAIRKQPFSLVLLDEVEKAHPDIVNSLLQMLDEGIMRDANNKTVSFKDAIIVATSNAGAQHILEYEKVYKKSPAEARQQFIQQLIASNAFKPEFLNRFDNVVVYKSLSPSQLEHVVDIQLSEINKKLATEQLSVALTPAARTWLAEKGHDPMMGARPLRRLMQQTIETIVSKKILEGTLQPGTGESVSLDASDLEANQQIS